MYDWACGKAATFPNNKKSNNNNKKKIRRSFFFFFLVGKASSVQFCFKKKCALDAQYANVFFFFTRSLIKRIRKQHARGIVKQRTFRKQRNVGAAETPIWQVVNVLFTEQDLVLSHAACAGRR